MGDIADLDEFKKQIKDHENNVNEYLGGYLDYIGKLGSVEEAIVNKELKKYNEPAGTKRAVPAHQVNPDCGTALSGSENKSTD